MSKKKLSIPTGQAFYGSLYMDAGEDWDKATEQIDNAAYAEPSLCFFDIVHTPAQEEFAIIMAGRVRGYIDQGIPSCENRIMVGLTTDDSDRPARAFMLEAFEAKGREE